jgi:hypothetical protein
MPRKFELFARAGCDRHIGREAAARISMLEVVREMWVNLLVEATSMASRELALEIVTIENISRTLTSRPDRSQVGAAPRQRS